MRRGSISLPLSKLPLHAKREATGSSCTARYILRPIHDGQHLVTLEDFFLLQRLRQAIQGLAVLGQDASRLLMGLCYQSLDLSIQALGRGLRIHTLVVFQRLLVEIRTPV
jgi:hypothetical protein